LQRGDIWWADLLPPAGTRPVVLLSRDRAYTSRDFITIAPVGRTIRGINSEVVLTTADGMRERCAVNLDDIQTISKARLRNYQTALSPEKIAAVNEAIKYALSLP
jgi:mRNA interferase MazF